MIYRGEDLGDAANDGFSGLSDNVSAEESSISLSSEIADAWDTIVSVKGSAVIVLELSKDVAKALSKETLSSESAKFSKVRAEDFVVS